jgi:GNS1/SUR4 family
MIQALIRVDTRNRGSSVYVFLRHTTQTFTQPNMLSLLTYDSLIAIMIIQSITFISLWVSLHFYVSYRGPIRGASTAMKFNSLFYSAASLLLLILILSPTDDNIARRLYHASKFYEYIDVINVRASGGTIDLHFGFHHLTTPYLTFFRVLHHSEGWQIFAALNAFHHFLMYAYFGGVEMVRPVLPWTGTLQLVVGILVELWMIREKSLGNARPNWIAGGILTAYLVLNSRDLIIRSREKQIKIKET